MIVVKPEDWILLYGSAIVALVFSYFASLTISLELRLQELDILIEQINLKDENLLKKELQRRRESTENYRNRLMKILSCFLILIGLFIAATFIFAPQNQSEMDSTYVCNNCSYQTTNQTIINNYNLTEVRCVNNQIPSVKELSLFLRE
jgi:hypothetical protein